MMFTRATGQHPSDGDLLRDLDSELSDLERRRLRGHTDSCAECGLRVDALRERASLVQRFLAEEPSLNGQPDPLARARALAAARAARSAAATSWQGVGRRRVAVAAIGAALLIGAAAVPPLRAWVRDIFASATRTAVSSPSTTAPTLPAAVVDKPGSLISFWPTEAVFELRVQHPQQAGTVVLRVHEASRATAQTTGANRESIMVLPSAILIENQPSSVASYRVTLPATLRAVRIVVGERLVATLPVVANALPMERTLHLDGSRLAP